MLLIGCTATQRAVNLVRAVRLTTSRASIEPLVVSCAMGPTLRPLSTMYFFVKMPCPFCLVVAEEAGIHRAKQVCVVNKYLKYLYVPLSPLSSSTPLSNFTRPRTHVRAKTHHHRTPAVWTCTYTPPLPMPPGLTSTLTACGPAWPSSRLARRRRSPAEAPCLLPFAHLPGRLPFHRPNRGRSALGQQIAEGNNGVRLGY